MHIINIYFVAAANDKHMHLLTHLYGYIEVRLRVALSAVACVNSLQRHSFSQVVLIQHTTGFYAPTAPT